jgi:hypothetical protein
VHSSSLAASIQVLAVISSQQHSNSLQQISLQQISWLMGWVKNILAEDQQCDRPPYKQAPVQKARPKLMSLSCLCAPPQTAVIQQ